MEQKFRNFGHFVSEYEGVLETDLDLVVCVSIGLVNPECVAFIGNGVVVHIPAFFQELDNLVAKGEPSISHPRLLRPQRHSFTYHRFPQASTAMDVCLFRTEPTSFSISIKLSTDSKRLNSVDPISEPPGKGSDQLTRQSPVDLACEYTTCLTRRRSLRNSGNS